MRLESLNGHFVELDVTGYQFGSGRSTTSDVDWDANWLMIHGKAWDGTQSWEFDDPCMTTWEARELASWLRGLGTARPATMAAADSEETTLWLTEPNLTFVFNSASQGITTVDVYFNAESRPPTGSNDDDEGLGHKVRLTIPQSDIAVAVAHWDQDLQSSPSGDPTADDERALAPCSRSRASAHGCGRTRRTATSVAGAGAGRLN